MQLSKDMAGFSGGQADTLRKAMGKKIAELMEKMKQEFLSGCLKNNIAKNIAQETFASMEKFAEYGFNKSHAACYALIAYQTAYLKANYPAEFMAALLTSDQDNMDRVCIEIDECKQMGIQVLPPDINESFTDFTVIAETLQQSQKRLRFGLKAIRNVGENIVKTIIKERKANGKYDNLENFLIRVRSKDLNKKSLEGLIKSGAMDNFGERNYFLENMDKILLFAKAIEQEENTAQTNLFALNGNSSLPKLNLLDYPAADKKQCLSWEKEFLGLYVSEHPFIEFQDKLKNQVVAVDIIKSGSYEGKQVITAGVITDITKKITNKGEPMLFVRIENNLAGLEILIFPRLYKDLENLFIEEKVVLVSGNVSTKDAEPKILASMAWELTMDNLDEIVSQAKNFQPNNMQYKKVLVKYPLGATPQLADQVKQILNSYPGANLVYLKIDNKLIKTAFKVKFCPQFEQAMAKILGPASVDFA